MKDRSGDGFKKRECGAVFSRFPTEISQKGSQKGGQESPNLYVFSTWITLGTRGGPWSSEVICGSIFGTTRCREADATRDSTCCLRHWLGDVAPLFRMISWCGDMKETDLHERLRLFENNDLERGTTLGLLLSLGSTKCRTSQVMQKLTLFFIFLTRGLWGTTHQAM